MRKKIFIFIALSFIINFKISASDTSLSNIDLEDSNECSEDLGTKLNLLDIIKNLQFNLKNSKQTSLDTQIFFELNSDEENTREDKKRKLSESSLVNFSSYDETETKYTDVNLKGSTIGLKNFGNTCYINASTILLATTKLLHLLDANTKINKTLSPTELELNFSLKESLNTLITSLHNKTSFNHDSKIKKYLLTLDKILRSKLEGSIHIQHDAAEFLSHLLEQLNSTENNFETWIRESLQKNQEQTTFSEYQQKFINIPLNSAVTLQNLFNNVFETEIFESFDEAKNQKNIYKKRIGIIQTPKTLLLQLNRFSLSGIKDTKRIKIPRHLDLISFPKKSSTLEQAKGKKLKYHLKTIITHLGSSMHAGHYVAYTFHRKNKKIKVVKYDDNHVYSVKKEETKQIEENAYILAYEL